MRLWRSILWRPTHLCKRLCVNLQTSSSWPGGIQRRCVTDLHGIYGARLDSGDLERDARQRAVVDALVNLQHVLASWCPASVGDHKVLVLPARPPKLLDSERKVVDGSTDEQHEIAKGDAKKAWGRLPSSGKK